MVYNSLNKSIFDLSQKGKKNPRRKIKSQNLKLIRKKTQTKKKRGSSRPNLKVFLVLADYSKPAHTRIEHVESPEKV